VVSLRQLRYLESLAETRHFGHAAEACAVSQPALSMQIKELEDELKVSLVERRKSGIEFTEQGEEIARRARAILASVRDLLDYAQHQEGLLSGVLKLGAIPSIAPYLLPTALPELQRRYPALQLQLRETLTANLVRQLVTGDLDLILVALPIEDPEVETLFLFDDRFILAAKATKTNQGLRHANADMLSQDRLLLLEEGHCLRDQALSYCHMLRHHRADGRQRLRHHAPAGDGDRQGGACERRHPPVALRCARAEAGDRPCLAQDLAAQEGLHAVRRAVARGSAAAKRQALK
jgi:LysR family hydrogen peroxide-inducible transcriptional activator